MVSYIKNKINYYKFLWYLYRNRERIGDDEDSFAELLLEYLDDES